MTTKSQGQRHSLPPKPMVAPPSIFDEASYGLDSVTERVIAASARDRNLLDQIPSGMAAAPMKQRSGHEWAATPPFPTPALTSSSMSSSSLFGERSPPGAPGNLMRRNFDHSCMTNLPSANSFDNAASLHCSTVNEVGKGERNTSAGQLCCSPCDYDSSLTSLSSTLSGLALSDLQGRELAFSYAAASQQVASSMTESRPAAPLLIPMQPTGAGVPLTSVVETLASKGSKAAAEDPETVAAAYKLSQWGIGIGPGINPKVASSRNGTHSRGRSSASEPPIVNTGNSGPMCVQSGDWICTGCGFVNWRRRDVCMRCFPHADGNDIGRGITGGEMLAKRLAAGLDTDTDEYRRSVQALCPDRVRRGSENYPQRTLVHELPRNPLQAYQAGSPSLFNTGSVSQRQGFDVNASNYLGIHLSPTVQQQWRQKIEQPGQLADQYPAYGQGQSQSQNLHAQYQSQLCPTQHPINDHMNSANSPYKVYLPTVNWTNAATTPRGSATYERPEMLQRASEPISQNRRDVDGGQDLQRSATHPGTEDLRRQPSPQNQSQQPCCSPSSSLWPQTAQEAPLGLSRDIWAPAPKRQPLVLVDPEDISRDKRVKPQPIGTRSATTGSNGKDTISAEDGKNGDGKHGKNSTTETAG